MRAGGWVRGLAAIAVALLISGCGADSRESSATSEPTVTMVVSFHALGGGRTWNVVGVGRCQLGPVRVQVTDGDGATVAVETVEPAGEFEDQFADCTTGPVEVVAEPADFYRLTVTGGSEVPLISWQSFGEFTRAEVETGVVVTARTPQGSIDPL